jgi:hypothetical protein
MMCPGIANRNTFPTAARADLRDHTVAGQPGRKRRQGIHHATDLRQRFQFRRQFRKMQRGGVRTGVRLPRLPVEHFGERFSQPLLLFIFHGLSGQ